MKKRFTTLKALLLALGVSFAASHYVKAEGGGKRKASNWGANRRVRTDSTGYVEASGAFNNISMSLPKDVNGQVTRRSNAANSKPSFYLGGGGGGTEFDAGLQYEWEPVRLGTDLIQPGWAAFISRNGVFRNPLVLRNGNWVPWRGSASLYQLKYKVWNGTDAFAATGQVPPTGSVSLEVTGDFGNTGNGTFFYTPGPAPSGTAPPPPAVVARPTLTQGALPAPGVAPPAPSFGAPVVPAPPNPNLIWPYVGEAVQPTQQIGLFAKRVICITQAPYRRAETDNSTFSCSWSNGRLTRLNRVRANDIWTASDLSSVIPAQEETGYDTPYTGRAAAPSTDHAKDLVWYGIETPSSIFKIQFPGLPASARDAGSENVVANPSRYIQENVSISLRNATRPWAFSGKVSK